MSHVPLNMNIATDVCESEHEDIRKFNEITDPRDIHKLLGDIIILNRYVNDFDYLFTRVVDVAGLCWGNRNEKGEKLQYTMIRFKTDQDNPKTYELPLKRFMMTLTFLRPVIRELDEIDIEPLLVDETLTKKVRNKKTSKLVAMLRDLLIDHKEIIRRVARMSMDWKELSLIFSKADMLIFDADNLILNHYREDKRFREINDTFHPYTMQTTEIVETNKRLCEELKDIMSKRDNPFFQANRYTPILKNKQLEELYINGGQTNDGVNVNPIIQNGSGTNEAYNTPEAFYAKAIGARVPDIMNGDHMGEAGYFARNMWILTYGTISKKVYDCGSQNLVPYKIDEVMLDMLDGRYYAETKHSQSFRVFHKSDRDKIGQTLYFRSPCTCNLNEDVCHICYGTKALRVGKLPGGFVYTTELVTKDVSQKILSAKHLLQTNSEPIEFSPSFDKYFIMDASMIIPKDDKRFDIYIPEDYDDNISEELVVYIGKDREPVSIRKYANIVIPDKILEKAKDVIIDDVTYHKISSWTVIGEENSVFCYITPINIMMTQKYMDIKQLFESECRKFSNVGDLVTKLVHLVYECGLNVMATHCEIMVSHLLRDVDDAMKRPDFTIPDVPYQILVLKMALTKTESFAAALAFENTSHNLNDKVFDDRNKRHRVGPASFIDFLFGYETI